MTTDSPGVQQVAYSRLFSAAQVRSALPPNPALSPTPAPWLYTALLGNSKLLVCLDACGLPVQVFYPYVDRGPHVRSFHLGVELDPVAAAGGDGAPGEARVSWLAASAWEHALSYEPEAAVMRAVSTNAGAGLRVTRILAVHPERDVLVTDLAVTNL
ncbi:MAG: hypothetical protein ACHQ4H_12205, partial [Ktedonobacterales bacterium]